MFNSGDRQAATALAAWYQGLPVEEQERLYSDLCTKSPTDLRRNFREGLRDMGQLKLVTITFLRANYGVTFSLDGGPMGAVKLLGRRQMVYA